MKSLLILVVFLLSVVATIGDGQLSCNCGWTNSDWRIVGGNETLPNEYPWMASVFLNGKDHYCGASIITSWHALTAAHCVWDESVMYNAKLVVGAHNLKFGNTGWGLAIPIAMSIVHEEYDESDYYIDYDIALLVTKMRIPFSRAIGPVCMPTRPLYLVGESVKLTGWGNTKYNGPQSKVLLVIDLTVISQQRCYELANEGTNHLQQKVCTFSNSTHSCGGDSGGPLFWLDPDTDRYTQFALTSYSWGCSFRVPTVNTDVSTYINWINKNIHATKPGVQVCRKI